MIGWTTKAAMTTGRKWAAAVAMGNFIHVAGGVIDGSDTMTDSHEQYDIESDSWTSKADLPTANMGMAYATDGERMFLFNGYAGFFTWEYNQRTNTWDTSRSRMGTFGERFHQVAVYYDGKVRIFSGMNKNGAIYGDNYVYNLATDQWSGIGAEPSMSNARLAAGIGLIDGVIYVFGGLAGISDLNANPTDSVEAFDLTAETWTTKTALPAKRYHHAHASLNGYVYAIGGLDNSGNPQKTVYQYDPSENDWNVLADAPEVLEGPVAVGAGIDIYLIGGESGDGIEDTLYRYTTVTGIALQGNSVGHVTQQETLEGNAVSILTGKLELDGNALAVQPRVLIQGGNARAEESDEPGDPGEGGGGGVWTVKTSMTTPRANFAIGAIGGKVYVAGGFTTGGDPTDSVEEYDPEGDIWTSKASMPSADARKSGVSDGTKLYIISRGWAYTPSTNTWQTDLTAYSPFVHTQNSTCVYYPDDNVIFETGGTNNDESQTYGRHLKYDIAEDSNTLLTSATGNKGAGGGIVEDTVYSFGGLVGITTPTVSDRNQAYDIGTDAWTDKAKLPVGVQHPAYVTFNGMVYAFGGQDGSGDKVDQACRYDPSTNAWTELTSLPVALWQAEAAATDEMIYVAGGQTDSGYLDTLYEFDPSGIPNPSVGITAPLIEATATIPTPAVDIEEPDPNMTITAVLAEAVGTVLAPTVVISSPSVEVTAALAMATGSFFPPTVVILTLNAEVLAEPLNGTGTVLIPQKVGEGTVEVGAPLLSGMATFFLPAFVGSEKFTINLPDPERVEESITFRTLITQFESGKEQRRSKGTPRRSWNLRYRKNASDASDLWSFYVARRGAYESFEWLNPVDGQTYKVRFARDQLTREVLWRLAFNFGVELIEVIE